MQELGPIASELQMEIRQRLDQTSDGHRLKTDSKPESRKNKLLMMIQTTVHVWEVLGYDPKPVDTIIEQSGLSARKFHRCY